MSSGSHISAASGFPAASGSDFAAANGGDTSGRQPSVAAVSSTERDPHEPICEPVDRLRSRADSPSDEKGDGFTDRRKSGGNRHVSERRQFGSSHSGLSPAAKELAVAIDQYKLAFRRRYITCEEMLAIITRLGYSRAEPS